MQAIKAENLCKKFGNIAAVDNISFNVEKGEIFGFLGPNGAGKTTTIRLLTGILTPDSGNISIEGINILKNPIKAKMIMGTIPENANVYPDLTAKQNLFLAGRFYGLSKKTLLKKSDELLSNLGLYERQNHQILTFSKGMKQRVSIAASIIHEPRILFLDEPTEGLDVLSRRLIIGTIQEMNEKGSTIFLTTHNIEEANKLCKRVCIINKGKIVAIGRPQELKQTFDKTQSIEVSFEQKVNRDLFETDFISKIDSCGDKWRLFTNNPDKAIKHVAALAEEKDLKIISLTTCGPSLEDAFVKLTGGEK